VGCACGIESGTIIRVTPESSLRSVWRHDWCEKPPYPMTCTNLRTIGSDVASRSDRKVVAEVTEFYTATPEY
jgi:hypothetical protein